MWIGSTKENKAKPLGIKWPNEPIKALGANYRAGCIGACKSADPCLFFAKSVDPPKVLFKSETTTTSENRSVEVQR